MTNFTYLQPLFLVSIILLSSFPNITTSVDTLVPEQSLKDGQTLVSNGQRFELGFFSPGSSKNRYLGIWYKDIPSTVLWVANRNTPIEDSNGFLKMDQNGNLVLLSQAKRIIWASKLENTTAEKALTKLLDSGNLIVRNESGNDDDTKSYIWQSFNHATDTLLPGMKLGWDSQVGFNNSLISWKSDEDPSSGDYSYVIKSCGCAETYLLNRETPFSRSGPWNGFVFNGVPGMKYATTFITKFVINEHQRLYSFDVNNASVISRLVMDKSGTLQRLVALPGKQGWITYWKEPNIDKVEYNTCGANGVANDDSPLCDCLKGFKPRSETEWAVRKTSGGCIRTRKLESGKDDGFLKYKRMKLPDCSKAYYNQSLKLKECKEMCKKNHSCTAYANSNITKGGSGCIFWTGDLVDLKKFNNDGQDLYVRVAASELDRNHKSIAMIIIITMISVALLSGLTIYFIWRKRVQKRNALRLEVHRIKSRELQQLEMFLSEEHKNEDLELPLIDINVIALATENFSDVNKLGEGGFGSVYKGSLTNGLHIAVKRLSKNSNQGVDEFKNEARLIAKLQHRNLVRILGCCIGGEEKMLIYEYVPNKSLDYFLFDKTKILYLDWGKRFNIILGIARGLLYLHQDCRLRIIHRDLKASNILLDDEMNPKISDFGMARIFGSGQSEANTLKVVGTYGYMSPEYAMDGQFSVKSDVFSYGVLILEIISGKKNKGFYSSNHETNLLGYAWRLWGEGKGLELMDESMYGTWSTQEVLKCIQVGLLCVQEHAEDRPTISSVILMLGVETAPLIQPKQPGFTLGNIPKNSYSFSNGQESCSVNDISFTTLEAR